MLSSYGTENSDFVLYDCMPCTRTRRCTPGLICCTSTYAIRLAIVATCHFVVSTLDGVLTWLAWGGPHQTRILLSSIFVADLWPTKHFEGETLQK